MFEFGTVVLVPFPFTDLTSNKLRPALIISKKGASPDIIVAFITSKTGKANEKGSFIIRSTNPHSSLTGLKVDSAVRFDKVATLSKKLILGELGRVPKTVLKEMKPSFLEVFGF